MNTAINLEHLSLESDEIDVSGITREESINPVFSEDFDNLQLVFDTYVSVESKGYVCRDDVLRVSHLRNKYKPLNRLLDRYPTNSFTEEPSRINYEVSNEGFIQTAYTAVLDTLKRIIEYIVEALKKFWKYLNDNLKKTSTVDDLKPKLRQIQEYILTVERVLAKSSIAREYQTDTTRVRRAELGNINRKWNGFLNRFTEDPAKMRSYLESISGVIKIKLPPFVDAISVFLDELKAAKTEQEVIDAIAKMELVDMSSGDLARLVKELGYNVGSVRANPKMTNFQSMSVHIQNVFKGWVNDRSQPIQEDEFFKIIFELEIEEWAGELVELQKFTGSRLEGAQNKIKGFKPTDLQPGLEKVFSTQLTPFMMALSSMLSGFITLEACVGLLTDARNVAVSNLTASGLNIVKGVDNFWKRNQKNLPITDNAVIMKQRRSIHDVLSEKKD